ncbi:MAG: hypothetical protein Q7T69_02625 [Rhodoferax sp.]|nr:hypothetical protein [Rhodoferax sp.]
MLAMVEIRVLRGLFLNGRAFTPGEIVEVSLLVAAQCVTSTRAELVDPTKRPDIGAALRREAEQSAAIGNVRGESWVKQFKKDK